ncbi:TM1266 family iron-only hydrogenase system putative regulator [Frisingicoccus sp.]|uniref:TM1266 family iron-only hydrogenase system putative regulator n=1 Tax=Frisingicoccus sp. TaxID=1918627 RepID=UPI0015BEB7AF|nr:TM1266 family iron-only hydrogenase system putative regulator [Frisingicoccus sp.]MEE0752974.1 TM1266 family iron-only hydrogenase system putative regulator [Frisingicoccus sp.]
METRIAVIGIIIENPEAVERLNAILHEYSSYILGRMGIPYQKRNLSIISIVIDAPQNVISALSGKLGMIPDVRTKTVYSKV